MFIQKGAIHSFCKYQVLPHARQRCRHAATAKTTHTHRRTQRSGLLVEKHTPHRQTRNEVMSEAVHAPEEGGGCTAQSDQNGVHGKEPHEYRCDKMSHEPQAVWEEGALGREAAGAKVLC